MDEQKRTEIKTSRRTFFKRAAALAAGSSAVLAGKACAAEKERPKVVLYRDTDEWKKYYETLRDSEG